MVSEKKPVGKAELSLQELEEITGGYLFEGKDIIDDKIIIIKPPILPGNIIIIPLPPLPPNPPGLAPIIW
ncbi:MAG: hypothetical protein GX175_09430 [Halanaerobiaceae bacterium]|nr:hypothetical protein [Halanaerobiaceae bacterium]